MAVTLYAGDNRDHLRRLIDQGVRVHSVVTDPPYGLTSITKRFSKEGAAPAKFGTDGAFSRASAGFMGKVWDGTGIERDPEFWRLILEILLPGGFVFAFSGSRTGHWQACAMELAGFIMHPMHGWVFGSGMPKAHNPCPEIDRHMGVEGSRDLIGETVRRMRPGADQNNDGTWEKLEDREYERGKYLPGSLEARRWDGWRHGTQSQKPALEPIFLAQKPYSEKTGALNLLKHGVGAMNIDGCRVGDRWPANLLHDGSEPVIDLFPDSAGQLATASTSSTKRAGQNVFGNMARGSNGSEPRGDSGSAARFFHGFPLADEDYAWGLLDPIRYQSKAKREDRAGSKHPTVKPIALLRYLVRHITPPGGTILDPFAGSGTTAVAADREGFDCILMEAEPEYVDFLRTRFDSKAEIGINSLSEFDLTDLLARNDAGNDLADLLL